MGLDVDEAEDLLRMALGSLSQHGVTKEDAVQARRVGELRPSPKSLYLRGYVILGAFAVEDYLDLRRSARKSSQTSFGLLRRGPQTGKTYSPAFSLIPAQPRVCKCLIGKG